MIPILYDSDEVSFSSNGLGRLRDCISFIVTEERNGMFECDFEYPVNGYNYDLIQPGRIIGVTHDDLGDVQPFDIVSFNKPIDGIVSFHCVHISYRQSFLTVRGSNINSLSDAFTMLGNSTPANPFTYETDMTKSGYMAAANRVPRSVREMLGGIEGSILDTYGGEYKFDKWRVILNSSRGVKRTFTVRYGVNMLSYDDELDISESYTSGIPYWTDDVDVVVGTKVDSGIPTMANHDETIPIDVSDKFETKPTTAQVHAEGQAYINRARPYLPSQTINISFERLQDMAGNEDLANLEQCELCDIINVIFPDYNTNSYYKIVRITWNVLEDKYEEMELGTLSTSLADALGVDNSVSTASGYVTPDDYIIEKGTAGSWYYEKYVSGKVEAWGSATTGTLSMSGSNRVYMAQNVSITNAIPDGIFDYAPTFCEVFSHYSSALCYAVSGHATSKRNVSLQIVKTSNNTAAVTVQLHCIYYPASYN